MYHHNLNIVVIVVIFVIVTTITIGLSPGGPPPRSWYAFLRASRPSPRAGDFLSSAKYKA